MENQLINCGISDCFSLLNILITFTYLGQGVTEYWHFLTMNCVPKCEHCLSYYYVLHAYCCFVYSVASVAVSCNDKSYFLEVSYRGKKSIRKLCIATDVKGKSFIYVSYYVYNYVHNCT